MATRRSAFSTDPADDSASAADANVKTGFAFGQ
jgi:hypothetical protein